MKENEIAEFSEWQMRWQAHLKNTLSNYLITIPCEQLRSCLQDYSQINGKLLRPLLIAASGSLVNAREDNLIVPALAVECIHTYSLIHDDLPAMDNADLRRGKPTCHKIYGEGMAILTGDALHTLAIDILANHPANLTAEQRLAMIQEITHACGAYGMAAGQAYDICVLNETIPLSLLEEIYYLKTGRLIQSSIVLGYVASLEKNPEMLNRLIHFSRVFGLAFQIQDDLLDIEGEMDLIGKSKGRDAELKKATYPMRVGIEKAKERVEILYQEALKTLEIYGKKAHFLKLLTQYYLERKK